MNKSLLIPNVFWMVSSDDSLRGVLNGTSQILFDMAEAEESVKGKIEELNIPYKIIETPEAPKIGNWEYVLNGLDFSKEDELLQLGATFPELKVPKVVTFDEFNISPFFPVMVKCEKASWWEFQYVITNKKQWKRLKIFLINWPLLGKLSDKYKSIFKKESWLETSIVGTEEYKNAKNDYNSKVKKYLDPFDWQRLGKDFFSFQKLVECPSNHYTSYRIITSANWNVIASSLLYSQHKKSEKLTLTKNTWLPDTVEWSSFWWRNMTDFLVDPKSRTYLWSLDVRSNIQQWGSGIVLNPWENSKKATSSERKILLVHQIDPENPIIPENLKKASQIIWKTIWRRRWLFVGIDFIQNKKWDFYYLETNNWPWLQSYLDAKSFWVWTMSEATKMIYNEVLKELID